MKKNSRKDQIKGFLALIGAATILSFYGLTIRLQSESFTSYGQLFFRTAIALILILIIIAVKRNWKVPRSERKWLIAFGVGNTIYPFLFTISVLNINAANSVMMLYVGGILAAFLIGSVFLREKITKLKLIGALLAFIGLAVFAFPFDIRGAALVGIGAGLTAGVFDAISNALRKYITETPREVMLAISFGTLVVIVGSVISLTSVQAVESSPVQVPSYIAMIVHSVCIIAGGYLLIYGFRHFDVNAGTIVLSSEIFISLAVNYFVLSESPSVNEVIGALIIFSASGAIALSVAEKKQSF